MSYIKTMENQETVQEFINRVGIKFSCKRIDKRPDIALADDSWERNARHFKTVLKLGKGSMTVYFSQGSGHTKDPTCADVLNCLASDSDVLNYTFSEWANDLGMDDDSIRAAHAFKLCQKQANKLCSMLGNNLFRELNDTERL